MTDRTDNFNRANGGLGANWTTRTDANNTGSLVISANKVVVNANFQDSVAYWSADSFQDDQYSQAVFALGGSGNNAAAGVATRITTSGTMKYYDFILATGTFGSGIEYYDGTTWSQITFTSSASTGDLIRFEVTGTTLTAKVNGSTVSTTTDANIASGSPGMHIYDENALTFWDDWLGGPITAGATLDTAWFRPSEDSLPRKFLADTLAAITLRPVIAVSTISGMAWFEPPDLDKVPVKIKVESPPALALTPATLPPKISGMAWFEPPDRDKLATKVLFDQLPAPMGTSFPRVYGIGWFEPPDRDKLATKVRVESPPALALTNIAFVSGIGWHNPPDCDKKATKVTVEASPAIALTPATLPPKIAGMAWFEPLDNYPPRALGKSDPHSFGFGPMTAPTPISGMAWFEPPDRNRPATKVYVEATPAWDPQIITATVAVPPTGWWTNPPDNTNRCVRRADDPSLVSFTSAQPILWWSPEDCKPRASRQLSDIPAIGLTTTSQIFGMAWFIIPDRDRPAFKQSVEAIVSLCLTPGTLPPKIAGMAWFQPWERAVIGRGTNANTAFAWNPQVITQAPPPSGDQYRVSGQDVRDLFLHDGVSYPSAITRKTNL